jgi:glycosyltransferase involved in cell wall biosynthesis
MEYRAHRAEREQLTLTHCTAVVSAGLIDYFISEHPVAPESLLCTPNGIDPDQVVSNEARVDELRHRYGLHGNVVIGFVGSIIRWQRLDLLIDAFSKIVGRYNDARLLIVGDSPLVETLKQQTLRLHLDERVVFAGRIHHSEVYNHIALMDIAVLPDNLWYGSPTKLFEYGAMGKAIVAPKNASLSAILTDQVEGLLVEPHVESLRRAIESLILDPHRRSRLGNAFRTRVHSSFTWRHNAERIIDAVFKPEPVA